MCLRDAGETEAEGACCGCERLRPRVLAVCECVSSRGRVRAVYERQIVETLRGITDRNYVLGNVGLLILMISDPQL